MHSKYKADLGIVRERAANGYLHILCINIWIHLSLWEYWLAYATMACGIARLTAHVEKSLSAIYISW